MALNLPAAITVTANVQGSQTLSTLARQLQQLSASSDISKRSLDALYTETRKLGSAAGNTISSLKSQATALRSLRDEAEFGSRKFKMLTKDIEDVEARLKRYQSTASQSGGLSKGGALLAGFAGGVAGYASGMVAGKAVEAVGGIAEAGLSAETAQVRLKALTDQFGEYNQAQVATERIARTLRISQTEATDSFAQLYAALRPTGVTLKETEDAFVGFTAAARASGATATESSAALMQLKQALGSGVLQGDELRSIREQAPLVGQAIAKEMGVTVGELKNLGSQGKITTDIVLKALATLKDENLDKLNAQFDTGAQAIKDFQVAGENLGKTLARVFGPTTVALIRDVTRGIQDMSDVLDSLGGGRDAEARLKNKIKARDIAAAEAGSKFGLFDLGGKEAFFQQRQQQIYDKLEEDRLVKKEQVAAKEAANKDQQQAKDQAARERELARERAGMDEAKKRLADQLKIREETEKRLADFREQSIRRATELERSLGDQRLELERNTDQARRRLQQQQQDYALETERQRLRGAGLSTDALDTKARLDAATRQYTEQKIQIEQNATDKRIQLERTLEDYKLSVARGISDILQDAADKMAKKMAAGGQAAAAAFTGATVPALSAASNGGIIARTGSTGQSTGPHLDARWADGRRITAADADRYLSVNGRTPSSYGVTSDYGPRSMFGRSFHAGMDFGTPSGSSITLKSGASVLRDLGFTGAGGYAVEIDTPEGRMRLLHLQAGSANATPTRPVGSARQLIGRPGAAAGAPGAVVGAAGVDAAGQRLDAALGANRSANLAVASRDLVNTRRAELGTITSELDQQRKSVNEQRQDFERIVQLERTGMTSELAQQTAQRERMARSQGDSLAVLRDQLTLDLQRTDLTAKERTDTEKILADTIMRQEALPGVVAGLTAEQQKVAQLQTAYEQKKQLIKDIAGSIGSGLGQAMDLLIEGTDNWGRSLQQIAAGVLKDIARQIAQTMVIQPIVNAISSIKFADGGIMTGDGPVPLRKYAGGGVANTPQLAMFGEGSMPEAYVPLPDGRRIPVALKGGATSGGGGGTNVTVNVDASGSKVQGDSGKGDQLGRVISQAVQNELIKQRRPGGLLAA